MIKNIIDSLYHCMWNYNAMTENNRESEVKTLACCIHIAKICLDYSPEVNLPLNTTLAKDIDDTMYHMCRKELMRFLHNTMFHLAP